MCRLIIGNEISSISNTEPDAELKDIWLRCALLIGRLVIIIYFATLNHSYKILLDELVIRSALDDPFYLVNRRQTILSSFFQKASTYIRVYYVY